MVKKAQTNETVSSESTVKAEETVPVTIVAGNLKFRDEYDINPSNVSPRGLSYLLQYGLAQSMQDAIAGLGKAVREEPDKFRKEIPDSDGMTLEELTEAVTEKKLTARFEAIIDGDVGMRSGAVRLSGIDKIMRDVARERLRAAAAKQKKPLPKKAEEMAGLVEKYLAKYEADVRKEAERRMESAVDAAEELEGLI